MVIIAVIVAILFIYIACVVIGIRRGGFSEEKFFLLSSIPLALAIMLMTCAHSWQDGSTHFWTVYHLSNQVLGVEEDYEWKARAEDIELYERVSADRGLGVSDEMFRDFHFFSEDDTTDYMSVRPTHMTYYSIVSYLPQVVGMTMGRLMGLSGIVTFLLARILTLAVYVILIYLAIRRIPIGKSVMMVLSLMPFTLLVASSFSYDMMVYVVSVSFISCMFSLRYNFSRMVFVEAAIYVALLGAIKGGGYLMLLPLAFLLVGAESTLLNKRTKAILIASLILVGLISVYVFDVILPAGQELFQFGKDESGYYAASYVWTNPISYIWMVIKTYILNTVDTILIFGGTDTGYLNIILMVLGPLYGCFVDRKLSLCKSDYIANLLVIGLTLFFVPMMLLSFTPGNGHTISGLRARYYLPAMPLVLILIGQAGFWKRMAVVNGRGVFGEFMAKENLSVSDVKVLELGEDQMNQVDARDTVDLRPLKNVCMLVILIVNVFGVARFMIG